MEPGQGCKLVAPEGTWFLASFLLWNGSRSKWFQKRFANSRVEWVDAHTQPAWNEAIATTTYRTVETNVGMSSSLIINRWEKQTCSSWVGVHVILVWCFPHEGFSERVWSPRVSMLALNETFDHRWYSTISSMIWHLFYSPPVECCKIVSIQVVGYYRWCWEIVVVSAVNSVGVCTSIAQLPHLPSMVYKYMWTCACDLMTGLIVQHSTPCRCCIIRPLHQSVTNTDIQNDTKWDSMHEGCLALRCSAIITAEQKISEGYSYRGRQSS